MLTNAILKPESDKNKHFYNGQLYVEMNETRFTFHPNNGMRQLAVYYDISGEECKGDSLLMRLKISEEGQSLVTIALEQEVLSLERERICEVVMETPALMMDCLREEYRAFRRPLQMFGSYRLESRGRLVRAVFRHRDLTEYAVGARGASGVHEVYRWLAEVWGPRCACTQYHISAGSVPVAEGASLTSVAGDRGLVVLEVAELCLFSPAVLAGDSFGLPWRRDCTDLLRLLAERLKVAVDDVRLLASDGKTVLRDGTRLDIEDLRNAGTKEPLHLLYDLRTESVPCVPHGKGGSPGTKVAVLTHCTGKELKARLGRALGDPGSSLIVSQKKRLLPDDGLVSPDEEVGYSVCKSLDDVILGPSVGRGGFGEVFHCTMRREDGGKGAALALKKCLLDPSDEGGRLVVLREIVIMTTVERHMNLVRYEGIRLGAGGEIYICMEYLSGKSLQVKLASGALGSVEIRAVLKDVLAGLGHLHACGIIHRDIKSGNILFGEDRVAKLCDFGISKQQSEESSSSRQVGTTRYMAPEVINGKQYSEKSDVWAVGVVTVEMHQGKIVFEGKEEPYILRTVGTLNTIEYEEPKDALLAEFEHLCLKPEPHSRPDTLGLLQLPFFG